MESVDQLLDSIKSRRSIPSDYKLAAFLGVVPGAVKHWRHGRSLPDARVAARIALELEMDPDVLVAELEAHRAQSEEARALWLRIASRLQGAGTLHAALLACLLVLGFTSTPSAYATVTEPAKSFGSVYYVKSLFARLFAQLRRRQLGIVRAFAFQGFGNVQGTATDAPAFALN